MTDAARPTVFHNPRCSKSRGVVALLDERGIDYEVVRYLDDPPDRATLERIVDLLDTEPAELVRKDGHFEELGLDPEQYTTKEEVVALLVEHPKLLQRPIVVRGDRAVIGRPPESVSSLL